jgi:hypothetical protein
VNEASTNDASSNSAPAVRGTAGEVNPCARERLAAPHAIEPLQAFASLAPEQLAEVLQRRVVIEQAKGIIMFVYGVDADDAFARLRGQSQDHNVKLHLLARQVAADLVELSRTQRRAIDRLDCQALFLTAHKRAAALGRADPDLPHVD